MAEEENGATTPEESTEVAESSEQSAEADEPSEQSAEADEPSEQSDEADEPSEQSDEADEPSEQSAEADEPSEQSAEADESSVESGENTVVEGKFGKVLVKIPDTVQKAPFESQKHYESIASKGETFKTASKQVLNADSKDDLKASLPAAIIVKKNLKKDVDALYSNYKEYKSNNENATEVQQFKDACNTVIRDAQKAHGDIKDKIHSVYGKS